MPFATTSHFSSTSGSESDIILKAGTPEKSVSSPLLSLTRSVISYVTSTFLLFANHLYVFTYENGFAEPSIPTEPMTLMTHVSSKLILIPNKPTTDKVDPPKAAPATATAQRQPPSFQLQHATRLRSSSYLSSSTPSSGSSTSVDLTYRLPRIRCYIIYRLDRMDQRAASRCRRCDEDATAEDRRMFEIMPALANAAPQW